MNVASSRVLFQVESKCLHKILLWIRVAKKNFILCAHSKNSETGGVLALLVEVRDFFLVINIKLSSLGLVNFFYFESGYVSWLSCVRDIHLEIILLLSLHAIVSLLKCVVRDLFEG